jgi:hypothetical protein
MDNDNKIDYIDGLCSNRKSKTLYKKPWLKFV